MHCWSWSQHLDHKSKVSTPLKFTMEPKNHHLRRRIIFQTFTFWIQNVIFSRVWTSGPQSFSVAFSILITRLQYHGFVGCPVSLINNYSTTNKLLFKDDSRKAFLLRILSFGSRHHISILHGLQPGPVSSNQLYSSIRGELLSKQTYIATKRRDD